MVRRNLQDQEGSRLLYVTDLHGWTGGYERIAAVAQEEGVTTIVNGGDMFPHGRGLISTQRRFIEGYLGPYLGSGASIFNSPARRFRDRPDNGLLTDVPRNPQIGCCEEAPQAVMRFMAIKENAYGETGVSGVGYMVDGNL